MKKLSITILLVLLVSVYVFGLLQYSAHRQKLLALQNSGANGAHNISPASYHKLKIKATAAKTFRQTKGFNSRLCFFVDASLPSNENRFFIYNVKTDSIENAGLVTHGRCNQPWLEGRKYSNSVGSGCTSLGRYKIGNPYQGRFGLAYKLYGLDSSNSNAYKRFVVLHAHECVPNEKGGNEICQSDGCPTVSPQFLLQLKSIINKSAKPVLLWVYN